MIPQANSNSLRVTMWVNFNAPLRGHDGEVLRVTATSESGATTTVQMTTGNNCKIELDGYMMGDSINVVVEGYQDMDRGAYFFQPYVEEGSVRERSQNLVTVTRGLTPVACSIQLDPMPMLTRLPCGGECFC